ncbi:MAG: hypothetical protein K6G68_01535 [Oscillospiraceae bacterium]|nr:hypothetical protein [Oscillospiraceae bacterium]
MIKDMRTEEEKTTKVDETEEKLSVIPEEDLSYVADFIDEITPDLEEMSGRMARIRELLNSTDSSPRERREAVRTIGEIFKYGMCEGFDSMYDVPGSRDDDEDTAPDERYLKNMMCRITRKNQQMRRWVNTLGIADSLECGVIVGVLMWKMLVMMVDLVVRKRKEEAR